MAARTMLSAVQSANKSGPNEMRRLADALAKQDGKVIIILAVNLVDSSEMVENCLLLQCRFVVWLHCGSTVTPPWLSTLTPLWL